MCMRNSDIANTLLLYITDLCALINKMYTIYYDIVVKMRDFMMCSCYGYKCILLALLCTAQQPISTHFARVKINALESSTAQLRSALTSRACLYCFYFYFLNVNTSLFSYYVASNTQ